MSRAVEYARLHSNLFMPIGGELGPTLQVNVAGDKKITSMIVDGNFLTVEFAYKGKSSTVLVPLANVIHMIAAKDKAN